MDFLKNLSVSLKATGPAAVLGIWITAIACVGIFGNGPMASTALGILGGIGGLLIVTLGSRS